MPRDVFHGTLDLLVLKTLTQREANCMDTELCSTSSGHPMSCFAWKRVRFVPLFTACS
jgi:hypothetical protein